MGHSGFDHARHHAPRRRPGFLGRELLELGALLLAAGAAHTFVLALGHSDHGAAVLPALGAVLIVIASGHRWWQHHRAPAEPTASAAGGREEQLWRIRVGVTDVPGGLATLTAELARLGVDIRLVQVYPGYTDAVDEFLATAPPGIGPGELADAVVRAGGHDPVVRTADAHELSDTTSRTLALVSGLVTDPATLPSALADLSAAQKVELRPGPPEGMAPDDVSGAVMCLPAPEGGVLVVRREGIPFTPVEFARCRALVDVAALLGRSRRASREK
ncbi:ACT domain-containing protein [Marinactinospora thermotolerans]|nr:hypothetical protein [Marinactinospora thermotolerans]